MWLSICTGGAGACGPTSGTSCARATVRPAATMKPKTVWKQSARLKLFISVPQKRIGRVNRSPAVSFCLEIEVKPRHEFGGSHVGRAQPEHRTGTDLTQPVEFVVPGKAGTARHKRVVAERQGVSRDISEIRRLGTGEARRTRSRKSRPLGLPRHLNRLVPANEDQLRAEDVMRLHQYTVPGWSLRADWQRCSGRVVVGSGPANQIPETLTEPGVIPAVLGNNLHVHMLPEVEQAHEALTIKALVRNTGPGEGSSSRCQEVSRRLAHHRVATDAVHAEFAHIERLAEGEEPGIGATVW